MPYSFSSTVLDRWFPYGYKDRSSVSLGLFAEAFNESGGGPDYGPDIAALQGQVAALQAEATALRTQLDETKNELALHENNGKHWTESEIDGRADVKVADHVTAMHP